MEDNNLADLAADMMDLLIKMFSDKIITYEIFLKNTQVKANFLKCYFEKNPVPELREKIKQTLQKYHNCLPSGCNSSCNIPL